MIKAIEIELQTKNFRPDQGRENKTPTEYRTRGTKNQKFFLRSWGIQLSSLKHGRKNN